MKIVIAVVVLCLGTVSVYSQTCPLNGTSNNKLVCLLPQVYGPYGLGAGATGQPQSQTVLYTGDGHAAHFSSDFLSSFAPINTAVGIQVSELPFASPSSSVSFTYDTALKTFVPTSDQSLGPILGDRATTSGRHRVFVALSYQAFAFTSIDGQNLHDLPTVLQHQPFPPPFPNPNITTCPNQTALAGTKYDQDPCFVRDYIQTSNDINLNVHQYTVYVTYGITQHLDFSAAIPIGNVRMSVTSSATIVPNSVTPPGLAPGNVWHQFNPSDTQITSQCAAAAAAGQACLQATFSDARSVSGIGDVLLRGKYNVHQWERAAVGVGVDVRLPTGDALNFLGAGAVGVKPFGVFSYQARISPHAEVGYEINGKSTLAGNNIVPLPEGSTTPVTDKASLPNRLVYVVGANVRVTKRLTGAFDIYGQRLFSAPELVSQAYTDYGKCADLPCSTYTAGTTHPDIAFQSANVSINDASLGLKVRFLKRLVATGNVLIKIDDGGLRSRVVPLVGLSYSF